MRCLVLVVGVVAGCWSASEPAVDRVAGEASPVEQLRPKRPAHSVWKGRYQCAQGPTALTLTMEHDGPTLVARFDFGPLAENPQVPYGSYSMKGEATTPGNGEVSIKLQPDAWIDQPKNYVMVGLEATTDRERRLLRGTITHATCGQVELSRVE